MFHDFTSAGAQKFRPQPVSVCLTVLGTVATAKANVYAFFCFPPECLLESVRGSGNGRFPDKRVLREDFKIK